MAWSPMKLVLTTGIIIWLQEWRGPDSHKSRESEFLPGLNRNLGAELSAMLPFTLSVLASCN